MEPNFEQITAQARAAATQLLDTAGLNAGDIFVVGCSSSEVLGGHIGRASSREAAEAVFSGIYPFAGAGRIPGRPVLRAFEPCSYPGKESSGPVRI